LADKFPGLPGRGTLAERWLRAEAACDYTARAQVERCDMGDETPTIVEWAGGRSGFERWLGTFYDLVEGDELLGRLFHGRVSDQHRRDVVTWWVEVMGGPPDYTDSLGGYARMLSMHRGLHITAEQRLRFVTLLSRAADLAELPDDPEFRAAIMGYAEWGTRLAVHNSGDSPDIVEQAPVPRWGWGVAPPYRP
jgi:hemoglobin